MTQYVKSTSFTSKDTLPPGSALKILKGTEIDVELDNIAVAVNSKADLFSAALTGVPTAPTASSGTSTTQIATTAFATASISPFTGAMMMWPIVTPPTGFLICNGNEVSRAAFAALFAIVGVTFGVGDGSTTFNLPSYIDRMPVGAGNAFVANQKGGSFDSSLPYHVHTATTAVTINDPGHQHAYNVASGGGSGGYGTGTTPTQILTNAAFTDVTASAATSIIGAGVSPSMTNMTPFIGMYFIIKY